MARKSITSEPGTAANGRVRIGSDSTSKNMMEPRSTAIQVPVHMEAESPILHLSTQEVLQSPLGPWRGNNRRRTKNGVERLPSVCHTTLPERFKDREIHPRAELGRYRTVLNQAGHEISQVLSNGAAHLVDVIDGRFSSNAYAMYAIGKGHALGWVPVPEEAGCTKRLIADGRVKAERLLKRDEIDALPVCKQGAKTCKHYELERDARRERQRAKEQKRADDMRGEDPAIAIARGVAIALKQHQEGK
jgi:hypothetical protein